MAVKADSKEVSELKKLIKDKNVVVGEREIIKNLRSGKLEKVLVASNCKAKDTIEKYASLSGTDVSVFPFSREEIGVICKRPYPIAVLGLKGGK